MWKIWVWVSVQAVYHVSSVIRLPLTLVGKHSKLGLDSVVTFRKKVHSVVQSVFLLMLIGLAGISQKKKKNRYLLKQFVNKR